MLVQHVVALSSEFIAMLVVWPEADRDCTAWTVTCIAGVMNVMNRTWVMYLQLALEFRGALINSTWRAVSSNCSQFIVKVEVPDLHVTQLMIMLFAWLLQRLLFLFWATSCTCGPFWHIPAIISQCCRHRTMHKKMVWVGVLSPNQLAMYMQSCLSPPRES